MRPALAKYGLTLQLYEEAETFGNLTGGVRQGFEVNGVTTAQAQLDTKPLFGLPGGIVSVSGFHIWGGDLSASNLLNLRPSAASRPTPRSGSGSFGISRISAPNFDVKVGEQSLDSKFMMSQNRRLLPLELGDWAGRCCRRATCRVAAPPTRSPALGVREPAPITSDAVTMHERASSTAARSR